MPNIQISLLVLSLVIFGSSRAAETLAQKLTSQDLVERGRESFMNRCSGCHGPSAEGNGPASAMLNPKPRNLVSGSFKFRSTPSGVLPTIEDLLRTLERGVPLSSMPSFKELSSGEKLALVAFIRSLRPEFADTKTDQRSLTLPAPPKEIFTSKAGLLKAGKRGKEVFSSMCVSCHGTSGMGDGPAAPDLTDSDNQPIRPADLTKRQIKSGKTVKDIFRAISTGLDGSPMPGFADSLTENQRWDLTAYIFYLRGRAAGLYTEKDNL